MTIGTDMSIRRDHNRHMCRVLHPRPAWEKIPSPRVGSCLCRRVVLPGRAHYEIPSTVQRPALRERLLHLLVLGVLRDRLGKRALYAHQRDPGG